MEKFDRDTYQKRQVNGEYNFTLKNGFLVRQTENGKKGTYTEEVKDPVKPFSHFKVFYMVSGGLKMEGEMFYDFQVGKWQYYDESGNLTKEEDMDEPFPFSIYDVDKLMQTYKVNIMIRTSHLVVTREEDPEPYYKIFFPKEGSNMQMNILVVDGKSGTVKNKMSGQIKQN